MPRTRRVLERIEPSSETCGREAGESHAKARNGHTAHAAGEGGHTHAAKSNAKNIGDLHNPEQAFLQGEVADDELGRVAKGRVQEAADDRVGVECELREVPTQFSSRHRGIIIGRLQRSQRLLCFSGGPACFELSGRRSHHVPAGGQGVGTDAGRHLLSCISKQARKGENSYTA